MNNELLDTARFDLAPLPQWQIQHLVWREPTRTVMDFSLPFAIMPRFIFIYTMENEVLPRKEVYMGTCKQILVRLQ